MRLKQLALILVMTLAVTAVSLPASGQGAVRVFVDGDQVAFDQPPVIQGSRVLVPLRGIFEQMGATVEWRPATRTVLAASGSTLVELMIGSRIARVNGNPVTLDVPAMIIGGRTLVPLRFISESLGANVQWDAASRTVLIFSAQAGQPPVTQPPPPPPAQTTTLTGIITRVIPAQSAQDQPRVTIDSGNISTTIRVTTDTAISRVETSSGTGGSVGVAALRPGDQAEVTLAGDVATRIRATWTETAGRIQAIAAGSRTIVLRDGRTIRYHPELVVLLNGDTQAGGVGALRAGQFVQFRLNPSTREAWEANIVSQATQVPGTMILTVNQPQANQTVGNPIRIAGITAPNAQVDIVVTWILG
ncbi:MAG: copper amine oxidase N-terminal domain-containing protein, partial [bacterium]